MNDKSRLASSIACQSRGRHYSVLAWVQDKNLYRGNKVYFIVSSHIEMYHVVLYRIKLYCIV